MELIQFTTMVLPQFLVFLLGEPVITPTYTVSGRIQFVGGLLITS